jgi:CheY-like chemotaxis protein
MKRILVIEDEPQMLLGLRDNLELEGYEVQTAADGEEGLAKRELNLSAIVGRTAEARERRLVPEVVESFFIEARK